MAEKTKVLLVEVLPKVAQKLRGMLDRIDTIELISNNITNSEIAIETVQQMKPDVVLLELDLPGLNGIQCTEIIKKDNPITQVIILSELSSAETVRLAMRAGAVDYLNYNNLSQEELISVVARAADISNQEKMRSIVRQIPSGDLNFETRSPSTRDGKIISVYSPKGGSGVSTVAANFGYALKSTQKEAKVLLLDLDLQFGDIGILFNQITNRSIIDLVVRVQNLDEELVETVIFDDENSGIDFLAAPQNTSISEDIESATLTRIFEQIRKMYDYIIINTSSYVSEATISTLSLSDLVILVAVQQVAAIRSIRNFLSLYTELGINREKLLLITNRMDEANSITNRKIGEMLNIEVAHSIPLDKKTAEKAANLGIPFVMENRRLEISKSIFSLMETVKARVPVKEKS